MADYKLKYTAEEVEALLDKVKSGGGLPVVELSYETLESLFYLRENCDLTPEESAAFEAAMNQNTAVTVQVNDPVEMFYVSLLCSFFGDFFSGMVVASMNKEAKRVSMGFVRFAKESGGWKGYIQFGDFTHS